MHFACSLSRIAEGGDSTGPTGPGRLPRGPISVDSGCANGGRHGPERPAAGVKRMRQGDHRFRLRERVAALAARRMIEGGESAESAKHKAATELLGDAGRGRGLLPADEELGDALREHLRCFGGRAHTQWLRERRFQALAWMERLSGFEPRLTGSLLDASATPEMAVELELFADSAKDVELALLDLGVDFRVEPVRGQRRHVHEVIGFVDSDGSRGSSTRPGRLRGTPFLLTVRERVALRSAAGRCRGPGDPRLHPVERAGLADAAMLRRLLADTAEAAEMPAGPPEPEAG